MSSKITIFLVFQLALLGAGYEIQPKIINGTVANTNAFPFFVSIVNMGFICSASLISDQWIITAAHCVAKKRSITVRLGIDSNGKGGEKVTIYKSNLHIYPEYFQNTQYYDIALMKLDKKIQLSPSVQPVRLPSNCDEISADDEVIAIGIGKTYAKESYLRMDKVLRQASFNITSCQRSLTLKEITKTPSLICTSGANGQGVAPGDSGGPLIRQVDGYHVQYGISKSTIFRGGEVLLEISTKISYFFDWISHTTGLKLPKCQQQAIFFV